MIAQEKCVWGNILHIIKTMYTQINYIRKDLVLIHLFHTTLYNSMNLKKRVSFDLLCTFPNILLKSLSRAHHICLHTCMIIHTKVLLHTHIQNILPNTHHKPLHLQILVRLHIQRYLCAVLSLAQENICHIIYKNLPMLNHILHYHVRLETCD